MRYFHEVKGEGNQTLSVDKLVVDFRFWYSGQNLGDKFMELLSSNFWMDYGYWLSTASGTFRHQFKFKCGEGNSFWLGVSLNTYGKPETKLCRLEFNPNKVAEDVTFLWVWNALCSLCRAPQLRRFDLAIDFPVLRQNAFLIKDRRQYREVRNSMSDRTQYLGIHNNHGFCKLYNKQIESKLNYPLTRLELTIDYEKRFWGEVERMFPVVRLVDDLQMVFHDIKLTDTDRYILYTSFDNPDLLPMLGRWQRKKIERILAEYAQVLEIQQKDYESILQSLSYFVNRIDTDIVYDPFANNFVLLEDWEVGKEVED